MITLTTRQRVAVVLASYVGLVTIACAIFSFMRQYGSVESYMYALFGPALSLFTHMGYFLFLLQSTLLLPWILLGATQVQFKQLSAVAFTIVWLAIGWYMHDLF